MGPTYIQTLKPNVTQEEALRTFSGAGLSTLFWRIRSGPLRRIADVYVPYWLYRVQYNVGRAAHKSLFAIDAVNGSLDLFTFPRIPDAKDLISVQTRNYVAPSLQPSDGEALLRQKVLRVSALFFSRASSKFAISIWKSRENPSNYTFRIGWDSMGMSPHIAAS